MFVGNEIKLFINIFLQIFITGDYIISKNLYGNQFISNNL